MVASVFAIELCYRQQPTSPLQEQLRRHIAEHPEAVSLQGKWAFYRQLSQLLVEHLSDAVTGCWDFWEDDAKARSDFQMWSDGLFTREGARTTPSGLHHGYREDRFLTVTLSFLMQQGSSSERMLAAACEMPEARFWQRGTFHLLLSQVERVSFASVLGDVVYLLPRDPDWALTADDLREPKFHYLRPLL